MSNPAAVPTPVVDVVGDGRWLSQHNRFIAEAREKEPEVLIVGDSIVQLLAQDEIWDKMFVPLHCLNFGIGGDQTQNVLWRLQNGELQGFAPKVIVILVGTNNHEHSVNQIVDALEEIVKTCRDKQPQASIILMGIPPRGRYVNPLRQKIAAINAGASKLVRQHKNVYFLDVDPNWFFIAGSGDEEISEEDMYDYLHFTRGGYSKLVDPLLEEIQIHLQDFLSAQPNSASADQDAC